MKSLVNNLWDGMNPIVVKELRQTIQGRMFRIALMLFMLIQFLVLLPFLHIDSSTSSGFYKSGLEFFKMEMLGLMISILIVIPFFAGNRFLADAEGDSMDLLYSTTITPWKIVWGKFLSAQVYILLMIAMMLPFSVSAYFLRGIDMKIIISMMALVYFYSIPMVAMHILAGVLPLPLMMKRLAGIGAIIAGIAITAGTIEEFRNLIREFSRELSSNKEFFWVIIMFTGYILSWTFLGLTVAKAYISPVNSNRTGLFRCVLAATTIIAGATVISSQNSIASLGFMFLEGSATIIMLVLTLNVKENFSLRVREKIPKNIILRAIKYLYTDGALSTLYLFSFRFVCVIAVSYLVIHNLKLTGYAKIIYSIPAMFGIGFLFMFSYIGVGVLLSLVFKYKKNFFLSPVFLSFVIFILFGMVPVIVAAITRTTDILLFTPVGIEDFSRGGMQTLVCASIMATVTLILLIPETIRSFKKFKRPNLQTQ